MPTTSNYALRYPASTGTVRVHTDIQNLATDADTALTRKGYIADGSRTTSSGTFTTVETVLQSLSFTAVAGVRYKITAVQSIQSTIAGGSVQMRLRWASGASVTTAGTQISSILAPCNTAGLGFVAPLIVTFTPGVSGTVTVGVTAVQNTGTGTISSFGDTKQINTILIEGV